MGKYSLHLIYKNGNNEITNRKSALGSYIFALLNLFQESNHDVYCNGVKLTEIPPHINQIENQGRQVFKPMLKMIVPDSLKNFFKEKRSEVLQNKFLEEILSNEVDSDIIFEFYTYGSNLGYTISTLKNKPLVVVYDAPVLEEYEFFHGANFFNRSKAVQKEIKTLQKASGIIVYSDPMRKYLVSKGLESDRIHIHQNIDFSRFDKIEPRRRDVIPVIGFIGSFLAWHRVDLLLESYSNLRAKKIDAKLILVGHGMEYDKIKKLVDSHPNKSDIKLTGFKDGFELKELKEQMTIGIMPGSNWYGAPNKIFEYGAAGLPVIAPDTPTINFLFGNDSGVILFEQNNTKALTAALEKLCTDSDLCVANAYRLQTRILEEYSMKNTFGFYDSIFNKILSNK